MFSFGKEKAKTKAKAQTQTKASLTAEIRPEKFNEILADASAGDSKHDFKVISKFATWLGSSEIKQKYDTGLPSPFSRLVDEDEILESVVSEPANYSPIVNYTEDNRDKKNIKFVWVLPDDAKQITTVTGKTFQVNRCQVKDLKSKGGMLTKKAWSDKYVGSRKFTHDLKIADGSAFIIDFAAVSFNTIMTNPGLTEVGRQNPNTSIEPQKTLYYVYASELENDPAGKTRFDDPIFKPKMSGSTDTREHKLVSCIPSALTSINYTYKWNPASTNPYDKFFTNYNFQLSELYFDKKSKKISYATNVRIVDPRGGHDTLPIINSGKANSIGSLQGLIEGVKKFFESKKNKEVKLISKNTFSLNASFLQKRSGDWLQVLLCLVAKKRQFKTYIPGAANNVDNIQKEFSDIYFVTHDRIAMAFALFMGVNVIFTHGDTQSAYSYKILDSRAESERINFLFQEIVNKQNDIATKQNDCTNHINAYKEMYDLTVTQCSNEDAPRNVKKELNRSCDLLKQYVMDSLPTQEDPNRLVSIQIINTTRIIFTKAMQNCYLKTIFPKIDAALENEITRFDARTFLTRLTTAATDSDKKTIIAEYNNFLAKCEAVENQISMFINDPQPSGRRNIVQGVAKFDLPSSMAKLLSQPAYKAAENWTWDISQGARFYDRIIQSIADTNYKNDKNVFLYNLQNLDDACKTAIANAYGYLYIHLPKVTEIYATRNIDDLTKVNRQKFVNVVQSFCVEVLLNCCPTPPNIKNETKTVDNIITEFIKKQIPLAVQPAPLNTDYLDNNNYYAFISEVNVVNENYKVVTKTTETINSINIEDRSGNYIELNPTTRTIEIDTDPSIQSGGAISPYKFVPYTRGDPNDKIQNFIIEQEPIQTIGPLLNMHLAHNIGSATSFHLFSGLGTRSSALSPIVNVPLGFVSWATRGVSSELLARTGRLLILNPETLQEFLDDLNIQQASSEQNPSGTFSMSHADNFLREVDPGLLPTTAIERIGIVAQSGGSSESDLMSTKNSDDISISENAQTTQYDELTDNSICFHPSLPIYTIANAYLSFVENDDIEESMEYELCLKYFKFMKKCQKQLASSYSDENNNAENKLKAYIIGIGLKQLFFTANVDEKEGYEKCYEALDMTEPEYYQLASLSSTISYMSSGRILQSDEERTIGLRILESPIFTDYIRSVNPKQIFDDPLSMGEFFNRKLLLFKSRSFVIETGQKIVADRTGQPTAAPEESDELLAPISTDATPTIEVDSGKAEGVAVKPVQQKPFDYRTLDKGPIDAFGQANNFGATISVGASGGKKKKRNTRYVKRANKTHKKHGNKKGGKRTRKHKKVHKKKFTRKHKK
uniref:Uncharacterized protein n=1 Tax=viral metagenome TaxID=1070528 RepID=A0A6C0JXN7_9ZZZZ